MNTRLYYEMSNKLSMLFAIHATNTIGSSKYIPKQLLMTEQGHLLFLVHLAFSITWIL